MAFDYLVLSDVWLSWAVGSRGLGSARICGPGEMPAGVVVVMSQAQIGGNHGFQPE